MLYLILVLFGFFLLVKGSDFLVDGSKNIAQKLKVPEIIIGMTIVAIGTSLPELLVSTTATIENHADIAIGNIVGSNISNLFLILGSCTLIKNLKFHKETIYYENFFMLFTSILLFFFGINYDGNKMNVINRKEGIILLIFCFLFLFYNVVMAINKKEEEIEKKEEKNTFLSIISIVIGIIALKVGAEIVIDNITILAKMIGISEKIISLTLVAFSTSLPELMTSIAATKKGDIDIAIGNVIGSNILNILLIIGVSSILCPITYSLSYNKDMFILIGGTLLFTIYPFIGKKEEMTKWKGLLFVGIYFIYVLNLIV